MREAISKITVLCILNFAFLNKNVTVFDWVSFIYKNTSWDIFFP